MRRKPFARVNSCGFACTPEASAKARKAAREGTIATSDKIQSYSIAVLCKPSSPMLELSSENARRQRSWAARLRDGLTKTRSRLSGLFGGGAIDPVLFETLESALLASDVGVEATRYLIGGLRERARRLQTAEQLKAELRAMLVETLTPLEQTLDFTGKKPRVVMLAGVNGSGK